jgi:hypothetical protein
VFVPWNHFQATLIFALPMFDEPEKLARDKHSSLLCFAISDKEKSFTRMIPLVKVVKLFLHC